jgi:hypothetical protein
MIEQPQEEWRDIAGTDGKYSVSNYGRVISRNQRGKPSKKNRMATLCMKEDGYIRISLSNGVRRKKTYAHRLVAEAFLPQPSPDRKFVNHKDGNKSNNYVGNLEWVTSSENSLHSHRLGLQRQVCGSEHWKAKLTEADIPEIINARASGALLEELAAQYNVTAALIGMICSRRIWKHVNVPAA